MLFYILCFVAGVFIAALSSYLFYQAASIKTITLLEEKLRQSENLQQQLKNEKHQLQDDYNRTFTRLNKAESENEFLQQYHNAYLQLQQTHAATQNQLATVTAQLKFSREKLDNQQNDILRLREQFRLEFTDLAQKILDDNTKRLNNSNEEKMKQILEPLKMNLADFKQKVEDTYDKESKERFSLGNEVKRLIEMSQLVSAEANNLATALKGNNKLQGNWGEMILESLLEHSGLTRGRDYYVQEFIRDGAGCLIKDENGKALQPDITILYPDKRKIIIDSKVSLLSWEQCVNCDEQQQRQQSLHEHVRSLRQHIDGLSRKNYPRYAAALDYVLLFIPIEPAFLEAVKADAKLWKYAYDKKVLLVSPTNLFSVLKIIADLWKVEQQNENAIAIAERAGALYDKFWNFIDNMETAGKKLADATDYYNAAFKQLTVGKGNLVSKVEELKKMGAAATKQLPERLFADD